MADEWSCSEFKEGFVTTKTGRIYLTAVGPPRRSGDVAVVCEAGAGEPGSSWCAVARLLSSDVRVYYYHRAGLGRSDASPAARTAANMAAELRGLLTAAHVPPPYVLLAHSYGGLLVREFVAAAPPRDVVGLVLVDTNQESTLATQQFPSAAMQALLSGFDYSDAIGLWTEHEFTAEELERVRHDDLIRSPAAPGEMAEFKSSGAALRGKNQLDQQVLDPFPVTVIRGNCLRDFERAQVVARSRGNGTPEQWEQWEAFILRFEKNDLALQREQLRLSGTGNGRFVQTNRSGHRPQHTEPRLVADEVLEVVRQARTAIVGVTGESGSPESLPRAAPRNT
ncbi:Alpha/beta-hydrolase [Teratosphaeria destructans]|uniref:Alpha/beta-hydrolase n=1 Tax=Teratosphaeria destructans TaxID=418781 RepID=A0A9W7SN13_9PEZI|nr:Alpha/beta-hydrolase [Teratosphaeria destructans]